MFNIWLMKFINVSTFYLVEKNNKKKELGKHDDFPLILRRESR